MKDRPHSPKGAYITLAAGFAVGAACMASMFSGATVGRAHAQDTPRPTLASNRTLEGVAALRSLDESFSTLVEYASPAVVNIKAGNTDRPSGQGSGFIFRADGYIVTNDHVVDGAETVTVTLKNGREYQGTVRRGEHTDIAVVKIEAKDLPTLTFADSSKVRPGQFSLAIGSPFGLENTATIGHISAVGRHQNPEIGGRQYPDMIQTDAAINMGNSGGPLLNINGQVIGVNTSIMSMTGMGAGVGFAIPSNQVKFIADLLIQKGRITRSMIGVQYRDMREFELEKAKLEGGALVEVVQPGGPAAGAGIKKGDVIVRVGEVPIRSGADLPNTMLTNAPGATVPVEVVRNGQRKTLSVKLTGYRDTRGEMQAPGSEDRPNRRRRPGGEGGVPREMPNLEEFRRLFGDEFEIPDVPSVPQGDRGDEDVPALREGQARLGVQVGDVTEQIRTQYSLPKDVRGAVVASVEPGSVGQRLGLQAGDVVLEFNGKQIQSSNDLVSAVRSMKWGDRTRIKFGRYGKGSVMMQERDVTFR